MAAHKRNVTRGKGTHKPEAQMDRTYRSFLNMNQSILLLPPGWDASALQGYPQRCVAVTHLHVYLSEERQSPVGFLV